MPPFNLALRFSKLIVVSLSAYYEKCYWVVVAVTVVVVVMATAVHAFNPLVLAFRR